MLRTEVWRSFVQPRNVPIHITLLKCRTNDDRYSSAGVGGLCVGIFSSLQGWLCVRVLCALQRAKNSVGSYRKSHDRLNLSKMLFRVTYNVSL
jgi:hypothetical protein